jgi:hypothetical protein
MVSSILPGILGPGLGKSMDSPCPLARGPLAVAFKGVRNLQFSNPVVSYQPEAQRRQSVGRCVYFWSLVAAPQSSIHSKHRQ